MRSTCLGRNPCRGTTCRAAKIIKMPPFTNSAIYPGTVRDWWIYVPKQYDGAKPACLMVFQDGGGYVATNGQYRVPVVFDNLIAKKEKCR